MKPTIVSRSDAPTVRAVRPGDEWIKHVEGGVKREKLTAPGILISSSEWDGFVLADVAAALLRELGWTCFEPGAASRPAVSQAHWMDGPVDVAGRAKGKRR